MEAGYIAQLQLLAQPAEPAGEMRIAAQLRHAAQPREGGVEISEKAAGDTSILVHRPGPERRRQSLDVGLEDVFEARTGRRG
jgi:hypothetical protein